MERISSRRKVSLQMASGRCEPQHMPSGRGVSGHISYGWSACLPDAMCHSRGRPDDVSHGIYLAEEECRGIFLSDGAHVFQTQSVTAEGARTMRATAYAFRTRSVRVYFSQTECMTSRCKVSWQRASGWREPHHTPSGRGVSGNISYRRSTYLPDSKCYGKGRPDDMSHGVCISDEEC